MGMYTQVRGWLNVDSISHITYHEIQMKLSGLQEEYKENRLTPRAWVCDDTTAVGGANGSMFLFFGTELKNYDNDAEEWIKHLIAAFPSAEGRIDFQYETENYLDENSTSKYWLIRDGMVIESARTDTWCNGYGNSYK